MSRDINLLHPDLIKIVNQLKSEFNMLLITETFRTVEEQNALYAKGRTTPGNIVTNAKGDSFQSQHQWGIAFDFAYNQSGNLYPLDFMNSVAQRAKQLGLAWGGDWTGFVDKPHIYMPQWGDTTTPLKNQYGTFENFKSTWKNETNRKEEITMQCFYSKNGGVFYFDGQTVHPLGHPDEVEILARIYRDNNGKEMPSYEFTDSSPWDIRLIEATRRSL